MGTLLAHAYPDRVAKGRAGKRGEFLLANGRGAVLEPANWLAKEPYLAVAEIAGTAGSGRILLAARLSEASLEAHFKDHIVEKVEVAFDPKVMAVRGRSVRRLGALRLEAHPQKVDANEETARALADGIAKLGIDHLPWSQTARQWIDRVRFMRRVEGEPWPDISNHALSTSVHDWLTPFLAGKISLKEISPEAVFTGLRALLPQNLVHRLDKEIPAHFTAPTGSQFAINYETEEPSVSVRVQELFGTAAHPMIGGNIPLTFHLLSPAHRLIQTTKNLPGFWSGSWAEVKREMRGQYPKHPWPDDPLKAPPTRRAKARVK